MNSRLYFLVIAILLAVTFWFFDSSIHYFVYGETEFELIPTDFNELWMRCVVAILVVGFGIFADHHVKRVKDMEAEKYAVYTAMLDASNHILRNFLTKMKLFRIKIEKMEDFDSDILEKQNAMIDAAVSQLENLEKIHAPSKSTIEERYKPR